MRSRRRWPRPAPAVGSNRALALRAPRRRRRRGRDRLPGGDAVIAYPRARRPPTEDLSPRGAGGRADAGATWPRGAPCSGPTAPTSEAVWAAKGVPARRLLDRRAEGAARVASSSPMPARSRRTGPRRSSSSTRSRPISTRSPRGALRRDRRARGAGLHDGDRAGALRGDRCGPAAGRGGGARSRVTRSPG